MLILPISASCLFCYLHLGNSFNIPRHDKLTKSLWTVAANGRGFSVLTQHHELGELGTQTPSCTSQNRL